MIEFCSGIPGGNGPHRATDLAGGICPECEDQLFKTASWGSAAPIAAKANGRGMPIIINPAKHKPKGGEKFRNHPTKRKQPWGMEKD